jgi:hypothetical protein
MLIVCVSPEECYRTPSPQLGLKGDNWARRTLGAEELSRDVESLATDNYNLLAIEQLLSNRAGQTTEKVSLAIDNDLFVATTAVSLQDPNAASKNFSRCCHCSVYVRLVRRSTSCSNLKCCG